ncbi:MAG: hypothetical protein J6W66_08270, partial [Lachnospiraceae bacterium]|nr:hypothetical protein [Lachnospiraceae bacterium]
MRKVKALLLVVVLTLTMVLGACGSAANSGSGSGSGSQGGDKAPAKSSDGPIKVGVVNNPPSESGYREANVKDMEAVFSAANGYELKTFYNIKNQSTQGDCKIEMTWTPNGDMGGKSRLHKVVLYCILVYLT